MQLTLTNPQLTWLARDGTPLETSKIMAKDCVVMMHLPTLLQEKEKTTSDAVAVPYTIDLPANYEARQAYLEQVISFHVVYQSQQISSSKHTMKLHDCLPVLEETTIGWTSRAQYPPTQEQLDLRVTVDVKSDRRARELLHRAMQYRTLASTITQQLTRHRSTLAIGLLPPILGCFLGVLATSPVWVPITLVVGILGFPLWAIVGVALSMIITFAAISTVLTVRIVQSRRLRDAVRELCLSPGGELMLLQPTEGSSSAEMMERAQAYVMSDPSRKLLASIAIDALGSATFVVPVLGELADIAWAPVSASLVSSLYSSSSPNIKYLAFVEEFLPFTDFIPTATIAWLKENVSVEELRKLFGKLQRDE